MTFEAFPKIPRLRRECVITEKIDGTNAQVYITDDGQVFAGSRNRFVTVGDDNYGFAGWVQANHDVLLAGLGPGRHFGEWWGAGIQRRYGLGGKRFSLFNTGRWNEHNVPACCSIVPVLYTGEFSTEVVDEQIDRLRTLGSVASPGFMQPEGIVVYHTASGSMFKRTVEKDEAPKGRG